LKDIEMLEVVAPADFATFDAKPPAPANKSRSRRKQARS
jgi:hypothetical protein